LPTQPLSALSVVGIRYFSERLTQPHESPLDGYAASGVYEAAGVPFTVTEPVLVAGGSESAADAAVTLGRIGGAIADVVHGARQAAEAVLMVGGNCTHITGVLGGLQDAHGPAARVGLVWFDAHGDYNTPKTTLTGSLGGMPVAVAAGLALPAWREGSHIVAPLPTDRIVLVDVRNLDVPERALIEATDTVIAAAAPGFSGADLGEAVAALAERVDMLYLHIDADILDMRYVPGHWTPEPDGPDMAQVQAAIETVMATGKVVAFAVVSVPVHGEDTTTGLDSGIALIGAGLDAWRRYGMPEFA
jgi:arginase